MVITVRDGNSDEAIIHQIVSADNETTRDELFKSLIERGQPSWKKKLDIHISKFFERFPFIQRDHDRDDLYNLLLTNVFTSLKKYDPTLRPFSSYCNSLIAKTFLNVRRNFNVQKRRVHYKDSGDSIHIYTITDSLDDLVQYQNNQSIRNNRHDHVASECDLELESEMRELRDTIIYKCKQYMSDSALEIFFEDSVTSNRRNGILAKDFGCSPSRISSIKSRQVRPVVEMIRGQLEEELDPSQLELVRKVQ